MNFRQITSVLKIIVIVASIVNTFPAEHYRVGNRGAADSKPRLEDVVYRLWVIHLIGCMFRSMQNHMISPNLPTGVCMLSQATTKLSWHYFIIISSYPHCQCIRKIHKLQIVKWFSFFPTHLSYDFFEEVMYKISWSFAITVWIVLNMNDFWIIHFWCITIDFPFWFDVVFIIPQEISQKALQETSCSRVWNSLKSQLCTWWHHMTST